MNSRRAMNMYRPVAIRNQQQQKTSSQRPKQLSPILWLKNTKYFIKRRLQLFERFCLEIVKKY